MRINSRYNKIPVDSDASIMTSGLLGGQYIGLTIGGADEYLGNGDRIEFVQDALVLENLISQFLSPYTNHRHDRFGGSLGRLRDGGYLPTACGGPALVACRERLGMKLHAERQEANDQQGRAAGAGPCGT